MSSTNRKNAKERHQSDYYCTPVGAISEFLVEFQKDFPSFNPKTILDPCSGGDSQHGMSYPLAIAQNPKWNDYQLGTIDIRPDSLATIKGDFLALDIPLRFDLIISNPPFCLAQEFITRSLELANDGGFVVMLLRLNFFGGQCRFNWWKNTLPVACYVHHARMSFTDDRKTDSIEYMHAVFQKGNCRDFTRLKII